MFSRPGPLPCDGGWTYEVKWDGFRAIVSTEDRLRVRSRRGWNMTAALPELNALPEGLVLDGELVAWRKGVPYFPWIVRRVLHGDRSVPLTYVIFDVLRVDGQDVTREPLHKRRTRLEGLSLRGGAWTTPETFDDREALYTAVCERGLEGVIAKRNRSTYRSGDRGWVKVKNPSYWRRKSEREPFRSGGQSSSRFAHGPQ